MRLHAIFIFVVLLMVWAGPAMAQAASEPIPKTCDPNYMAAMDARAWMGGKRDMESAQSTIVRSQQDSILDLTCFEEHVTQVGRLDQKSFSDGTTRYSGTSGPAVLFRMPPLCFGAMSCPPSPVFGFPPNLPYATDSITPQSWFPTPGPNPPGGPFATKDMAGSSLSGTGETGEALVNLVRIALRGYLQPNFYKPEIPLPKPPAYAACGSMSEMWRYAKCTDFKRDGWITLKDHVCDDRRDCEKCLLPGERQKWGPQFKAAYPPPVPRYDVPAPTMPTPPGGLDKALTYKDTLTGGCGFVTPVPTGLKVYVDEKMEAEAICPAVNCWYSYKSKQCGI